MTIKEWGEDHVGSHWRDFGFYSKGDGQPLEDFESRRDMN